MLTNENNNPLLKKLNKSNTLPPMTYRLPSKGLPYENGELSDEVIDGEFLIYPMSMLDEIYLKTPDMLFQGTAIEKTISRCCPQLLKPLDLLSKDVDFVLTAMRQVSYGNILSVDFKCECEKSKQIELEIPISGFINTAKSITPETLNNLTFELEGFLIKVKYVTFSQMLALNAVNSLETPDEIFETFVKNLAANIESIDEVDNVDNILEFIRMQTRHFQLELLKKIQTVNEWGVDFDYTFTCKWCNTKQTYPISLNPTSFFTEPSDQEVLKKRSA